MTIHPHRDPTEELRSSVHTFVRNEPADTCGTAHGHQDATADPSPIGRTALCVVQGAAVACRMYGAHVHLPG